MKSSDQTHADASTETVDYSWGEVWRLLLRVTVGWSLLILSIGFVNADEVVLSDLAQVTSGSLLYQTEEGGGYQMAPTLKSDVKINVTGMIARATVRQSFKNETGAWVEGIYVFPLPEDAAVDRMKMWVGERIIIGEIKVREEAKKIYTKARSEGKKASLIEQERPNLFTNSVANIGPGEMVVVEIEYQQTLRYVDGEFSLRFPMAMTPRYIPGDPVIVEEAVTQFNGSGWALDTDQVSDASRITPPVLTEDEKANPVSLTVTVNSGFALASIESRYHAVNREHLEKGITKIALLDDQHDSDRDFELVWRPESGVAPKAALFSEERDGNFYHLLMVLPPSSEQGLKRINREVIYVIDRSGSMSGTSIKQAKRALKLALSRLGSNDRFNVISFSSNTDRLFSSARSATRQNIRAAQHYVSSLTADGGTEMRSALEAALKDQRESNTVRQVVFLTDGSVGNEAALFRVIKQYLGNSRLFTIGIGSAPNSHFMSKAAQYGRGTFTYIGDVSEVESRMDTLFQKLEMAVMTDVKAAFDGHDVEMWPERLPDLYHGEPLVVTARTGVNNSAVVVSGRRGDQHWRSTLSLPQASDSSGIATLWARNKIAALMDRMRDGEKEAEIRPQVVSVALQHHLVSKYTSLVAVDKTPSRPDEASLSSEAVPLNLPHGQEHAKIFGRHAQGATSAQLQLITGAMMLLIALWLWCRQRRVGLRYDL